jgi:hypothetical protein
MDSVWSLPNSAFLFKKCIEDLNIRTETLQLVQEKSGNTLEAKGKDFLRRTQLVQKLIESMGKWD